MIAERFAGARVAGVEISSEMLAKATEPPNRIEWIQADIAGWEPERAPELIYSNAALHWIDDHAALFPSLFGFVAPGGCLAVQMPLSFSMSSHVLMRETLANGGVNGSRLGDEALAAAVVRKWVLDAGEYYDLLAPEAASVDIWETEYIQRLEGDDPVLEWVKADGASPDPERPRRRRSRALRRGIPRTPAPEVSAPRRTAIRCIRSGGCSWSRHAAAEPAPRQ